MGKSVCKLVGYIRVSTDKQGRSGLGLEAQQSAIALQVEASGCQLVATYTEVESGKRSDRPELSKAIAHAKRIGATLVFAKLDRLSRNARFLLGLVESGVDMLFCDMPTIPTGAMGKFMLTQMASIAELEAGLISERTKAALRSARERGVRLGGYRANAHRFTDAERAKGADQAGETYRGLVGRAYANLVPEIEAMRSEGLSFRAVADRLNADGHTTRQGKPWNHVQVKRVLDRDRDRSAD